MYKIYNNAVVRDPKDQSFHAQRELSCDDCEESTSAFKMRRNCRVLLAHRLNGCFANGLLCHDF